MMPEGCELMGNKENGYNPYAPLSIEETLRKAGSGVAADRPRDAGNKSMSSYRASR
jgi:hypothetical protein